MWQKTESKLDLAASMVRQVMPELSSEKNVVILCDSWYAKKNLVRIVDENIPIWMWSAMPDVIVFRVPHKKRAGNSVCT